MHTVDEDGINRGAETFDGFDLHDGALKKRGIPAQASHATAHTSAGFNTRSHMILSNMCCCVHETKLISKSGIPSPVMADVGTSEMYLHACHTAHAGRGADGELTR